MNPTLHEFLTGIIDYAGLFPPAALDMRAAVRNYDAYRQGENSRWLGRFVVPVAKLDEFEKAAGALLPDGGNDFWRLSALGGVNLSSDLNRIAEFNARHAGLNSPAGAAIIDAIEIKAEQAAEIETTMALIPEKLVPYFEVPIANDPTGLIKAIAGAGGRAKVRTGGVTADAFPSSFDLARFIAACAEEDVPFKATAGLHHPIRSINRLTYEPGSATAMMHGFLNVFLAAAFAQNGMSVEVLEALLEETTPEAFQFSSGGVRWRGEELVRAHLRNTRSLLALSFGSCSFEEPIEDLKKIGLL
ncbi:MAG: hypothetical protein ACREEM_07595 [Blastocatellia bacterium]